MGMDLLVFADVAFYKKGSVPSCSRMLCTKITTPKEKVEEL
jgi:hypothetical protein